MYEKLSKIQDKPDLEESISESQVEEVTEESKAESVKATTPKSPSKTKLKDAGNIAKTLKSSDHLDVHVDEKTGTTFVKTKNPKGPTGVNQFNRPL